MINVLQAMILTEGDRMVLTPTYHLFKMMKPHMDGERLELTYDEKLYDTENGKAAKISMSASEKNGVITVSACNTSLSENEEMTIDLSGANVSSIGAQILTGEMNDCNTFDEPDKVKPEAFDVSLAGGKLTFTLPAKSAVVISLK